MNELILIVDRFKATSELPNGWGYSGIILKMIQFTPSDFVRNDPRILITICKIARDRLIRNRCMKVDANVYNLEPAAGLMLSVKLFPRLPAIKNERLLACADRLR